MTHDPLAAVIDEVAGALSDPAADTLAHALDTVAGARR